MDEKESLRRLMLHPEEGKAAVTSRPAGRRPLILVVVAVMVTATSLLFLSSMGGLCGHLRLLPASSSSSSAAGTDTQLWPETPEAPSDRPPAVASRHISHGVGDGPEDAPSAELFRDRAGTGFGTGTPVVLRRQTANVTTSAATATATVLEDFEVHQPVLTPLGATLDDGQSTHDSSSVEDSCSVVLMDYVFAYSYNEPYISTYTPPSCEFNRVVLNYTVVSEGRQL